MKNLCKKMKRKEKSSQPTSQWYIGTCAKGMPQSGKCHLRFGDEFQDRKGWGVSEY